MRLLIVIVLQCALLGCGVKGDPLPTEEPTALGRGKPTYQRAMRKIKVKDVKAAEEEGDSEDNEEN
jgi:hypothetical protein